MEDLQQFKTIFFEESFENLAVLESTLVSLDPLSYSNDDIKYYFLEQHILLRVVVVCLDLLPLVNLLKLLKLYWIKFVMVSVE